MPSLATNLRCNVCGGVAETFRYGAQACRACAAFFRRTVVKEQRFECVHGGGCDLSTESRCVCRACRFEGCLAAGMNAKRVLELAGGAGPSSSSPLEDYARGDSRCFSFSCDPGTSSSSNSSGSPPENLALAEVIPPTMTLMRNEGSPQEALSMRMPLLDQLITGYSRLMDKRMNYTPAGVPLRPKPYAISHEHKMEVHQIDFLNFFDYLLRYFPHLNELNETLKQQVHKSAYLYLATFNKSSLTVRMFPDREDVMAFFDGNFIDKSKLGEFMAGDGSVLTPEEALRIYKPSFDLHEDILTAPLRRMQLSGVEEVALIGLIVANCVMNDLAGYADDMAMEVQKEIFRELFEYYSSFMDNEQDKTARVGRITSVIAPIERLVALQRENFEIVRTYAFLANKPTKKAIGCGG